MALRHLTRAEASNLDGLLMSEAYGFSIDQLMELAGLSVAQAVYETYGAHSGSMLVCCGPGNNGGDGLVAARHLAMFGVRVEVLMPVRKPQYSHLIRECEVLRVPLWADLADVSGKCFGVHIDALFGFGYAGTPREPFSSIIKWMCAAARPIVSVDVPSGWPVDLSGTDWDHVLQPDMLISLSAPVSVSKQSCSYAVENLRKKLSWTVSCLGRPIHSTVLAQTMAPAITQSYSELATQFQLNLPPYPGAQQFLLL